MSFTNRRQLLRAAALAAAVFAAASGTARAKEPNAEVKRLLFPAQAALGVDSLDLAEREARKALAVDPTVTDTHLILAEAAFRRGDLAHAEGSYQKALELGGATAQAQAGLALVALAREDYAAAETAANVALAADKGLWYANYAMGRVLLAEGKSDEAFKSFEKGKGLKTRAEGRDLFENGMGLVALAENDASGAETNFIKARAQAPNTVGHVMALAAMYEAINQWSQAANLLLATESKVGSSPLLSYRLGRAYEKQQQWNDALRQYQKALKADSTFSPAMAALGHLYLLDKSKTGAAVEILSRAVAQQPTSASRLDLGIALTRTGKAADAVPQLETVLNDDPSPEGKVALARAYVLADMLDKGLPLYEDPDVVIEAPAGDFMATANALIKAKRYDEAKSFLDRAIEKDPNLSEVYAKRGLIDLVAKNYEAAIVNFQKKLEMDPKSATAHLNMGSAYLGINKKPEALAAYRKATQIAPNSAAVWVQLAEVLVADSTAAAQKAFERALVLEPQNVDAKRGKGLTFLLQEQYPQAIGALREATQADPSNVDAWVWLGQGLLNSGNRAEAKTAYERALKLDPGNKDAREGLQLINGAGNSR